MRLIDADSLQFGWCGSEMCDKQCDNCNKRTISKEDVDNAHTVEEITNEDIQQAIKEGFANGYAMAKAKYERPTGEWIEVEPTEEDIEKCLECPKYIENILKEAENENV